MFLHLDIGNTRIKWRAIDAFGQRLEAGQSGHSLSFLDDLAASINAPDGVYVSCVAKKEIEDKLRGRVMALWGVEPRFAETRLFHAGLKIAYNDPARLGVDRWLAMLAAWHDAGRSVCVIDCGSAVTVDRVDSAGLHLGGYIVPGIAMQTDTLLKSTGQIRMESAVAPNNGVWGRSTEEAVNFGVWRMVASFIDAIVDEVEAADDAPAFYICGGDVERLLPMLRDSDRFYLRPELVMDGLAIAFD